MKKVYIVGIGPGSREYILPKAVDTMNKSDVVLAFSRAAESISFVDTNIVVVRGLAEILEIISSSKYKNISVAASGDPLFYGITDFIKRNYNGKLEIVPGISSFQYLTSRVGKSWSRAYLGSLHGREEEFINRVKENTISIWLTDKDNSPEKLCKIICKNNINAQVHVGENLSYGDENIVIGTPEEISNMHFNKLCVMIVEVNANEVH